jgi:acetylornithine deacetylase/succinyl-diaminopimelate desuccinylase-like protein
MTKEPLLKLPLAALLGLLSLPVALAQSADQQRVKDIHRELVEINTTNSVGSCTQAADAMRQRLLRAGFPEADMQVIVPPGAAQKGNLVARYHGTGGRRPILLLAHLDVVEAKAADWQRDPFKVVEENGYVYGRGVFDDKAMAAIFVANLIRYAEEGYRPQRDVILALTCDEELVSLYNGVEHLIKNHRDLIDAELVLNEGAYGMLDKDGRYVRMAYQAGEKVVLQYQLETTNPGGHSSRPTRDNAIYRMAEALARLGKYQFPVNLSEVTRGYFERMSRIESGQTAADMQAILSKPPDAAALERLSMDPHYNATLRTTCVATMIQGGHAFNALPQRVQAQVNCRVLPNDSLEDVERQLIAVLADDQVKVTPVFQPTVSPIPPVNAELVAAIEEVSGQVWPGIPVIPTLSTGATDGRFLNNVGIWTYGVSGLFSDLESGVHGLNERLLVRSLFEGQEFLYRLVKRLGGG